MKSALQKLFAPLLDIFENSQEEYVYKPSHRTILMAVGCLFLVIAGAGVFIAIAANQPGGAFPAAVFGIAGFVCIIVATLGSDKAVANIWKNR